MIRAVKKEVLKKEFLRWVKDRPAVVKSVAKRYPPWVWYRVKAGAPYSLTGPGSVGYLISYFENGEVGFVCVEHKPSTLVGSTKFITGKGKVVDVPEGPIKAAIDPCWLEKTTEPKP